jgi:hypothetical protein
MSETTLNNLRLLREARQRQGASPPELDEVMQHLEARTKELSGTA